MLQPEQARVLGTELERDTKAVVVKLADVRIADTASLEQAVLDRQELGDRTKRVVDFFKPFKDTAHKLHKMLCDREREILAPLEGLDARLKRAITDFKAEQDRLRRDEETRLANERREQEQTRMAAEAATLESAGETALAAAVMEQAIAAPAPVVVLPDATRHIEGLKFRREWKWRPAGGDTPEGRARALQLVPRDYLCLDEKKIGSYARSMKETGKIPGIEIYYEDVPVR